MSSEFQELEHAACNVIQMIKQIPELWHTRLAVIGGLALWHYHPEYRPADVRFISAFGGPRDRPVADEQFQNINFITNVSTSPGRMKKRLLELPNSPFYLRSQALFYQSPSKREIQIDISPEWLCPYLPESACYVRDIPYGTVPYISLVDLTAFELDSSGLCSCPVEKERDARDAAALIDREFSLLSISSLDNDDNDDSNERAAEQNASQTKGGRPHANSDSAYRGIYGRSVAADPGATRYYERLDKANACAGLRRGNSLRSGRAAAAGAAPHPGLARSSSYAGYTSASSAASAHRCLTRPKTGYYYPGTGHGHGYGAGGSAGGGKRSRASSNADSGYGSERDGEALYYLSPLATPACEGGGEGEGYFETLGLMPSGKTMFPSALGTVTEHPSSPGRRTRVEECDEGAKPGVRRKPGMRRSVTFQV
ncbi:hypothetical protein F5Y15DRAFT_421903 [Xylariaceae sp. FL0016]|nr:hypothetical protein F5Y15DRAFT_421903 [Xylariaceae sp. FL0016]